MTASTAIGGFVFAAGAFFGCSRALGCHATGIVAVAALFGRFAVAAIVPNLSVVNLAIAAVGFAAVTFFAEQLDVGNLRFPATGKRLNMVVFQTNAAPAALADSAIS